MSFQLCSCYTDKSIQNPQVYVQSPIAWPHRYMAWRTSSSQSLWTVPWCLRHSGESWTPSLLRSAQRLPCPPHRSPSRNCPGAACQCTQPTPSLRSQCMRVAGSRTAEIYTGKMWMWSCWVSIYFVSCLATYFHCLPKEPLIVKTKFTNHYLEQKGVVAERFRASSSGGWSHQSVGVESQSWTWARCLTIIVSLHPGV